MSYFPGWYEVWCEAQGINAHRPDSWSADAQAAFMAEKLARFRAHWQWLSKLGQPAIIRRQSGRAELIRQVRRDLDDALSEPPGSGPYESFRPPASGRSHAERPTVSPWREIPIEDVLAWVEATPDRIGMSEMTARCLCWLEKEFSLSPVLKA